MIIARDSQRLSILQTAFTDHDLNLHHELVFRLGEMRRSEGRVFSTLDGTEIKSAVAEILY